MSWQQYVDEQLIGAGLSGAAILGHDGGTWAKHKLDIPKQEGEGLVHLFNNPGDAFAKGINVGGVKYMCIKADSQSIYGKKGAGGCVCAKTGQSIVIGIYDDKIQPGPATLIVEKLGDYLKDNNY
ncbi:hypothetical protein RB653_000046 [Dictyostelium firmibasis]|uniref:Profilin n=1 Tax=Dictyostelium firmibasis TaxID=79012 RepID=A0AAN7U5G7_9MYCE